MNPTRRTLVGAGIGVAAFTTFANEISMKNKSSKDARSELERAVGAALRPASSA